MRPRVEPTRSWVRLTADEPSILFSLRTTPGTELCLSFIKSKGNPYVCTCKRTCLHSDGWLMHIT